MKGKHAEHAHISCVDKQGRTCSRQNTTRNKLGLNPSKTRYMIFNHKTEVTNLVKIGDEYIERVWNKGKEKSFKLVGIWADESLKWTEHINAVPKKMNHALCGLTKASK